MGQFIQRHIQPQIIQCQSYYLIIKDCFKNSYIAVLKTNSKLLNLKIIAFLYIILVALNIFVRGEVFSNCRQYVKPIQFLNSYLQILNHEEHSIRMICLSFFWSKLLRSLFSFSLNVCNGDSNTCYYSFKYITVIRIQYG